MSDIKVFGTFGKCIVSGEHSVLRGSPALIFPVESYELSLKVTKSENTFIKQNDLVVDVLDRAQKISGNKECLNYNVEVENTIPVGSGLGASASLCVSIGKWFCHEKWISKDSMYEFCRELENHFHGESSGADVAAVLANRPIEYVRGAGIEEIDALWRPNWYLKYAGKRGVTSECILKVKGKLMENPQMYNKVDDKMKESVKLIKNSLVKSKNFEELVEGINLGEKCFEEWGLIPEAVQDIISDLKLSAHSVKPTGSGNGGHLLALYRDQVSEDDIKEKNLIKF